MRGDTKQSSPSYGLLCVDPVGDISNRLSALLDLHGAVVKRESRSERVLERFEGQSFDVLVILDKAAAQGDMDSLELIETIVAKNPATQVIYLAERGGLKRAMAAVKKGAFQYGVLPISDEELRLLALAALEYHDTTEGIERPVSPPETFGTLVGQSPIMKDLFRSIRQAASTPIPVLIIGETGTGKDLVAQAIHAQSDRRDGPYVPVHLGALPPELVASELFGHERGAFTGAVERRAGKFEEAHSGTIFMDEIGTIDEKIQISLLRLIEQRKFTRLGGRKILYSDARIIAATNENLLEAVAKGAFREDLYYRLDVFHVHVPALRDRRGDIPLLVESFIERYNQEFKRHVQGIAPELVRVLENHSWPGNVRELKNVIQRAVLVCSGEVLRPEHLPARFQRKESKGLQVQFEVGTPLEVVEREMIERTLALAPTRKEAAAMLGISRRALYNKLSKYGLI